MKFRKKPVLVEAMQFGPNGDPHKLADWMCGTPFQIVLDYENSYLTIGTPEGEMRANLNDWIIRGVNGEFYPCKPDIFEATYEPIDEDAALIEMAKEAEHEPEIDFHK